MLGQLVWVVVWILSFSFTLGALAAPAYRAGVLQIEGSQETRQLADQLTSTLTNAGYDVTALDVPTASDPTQLAAEAFDLLVIPDSATLPQQTMQALSGFLASGGDLIALNAPLWQRTIVSADGRWLTQDEYQREFAKILPDHVLFDFTDDDLQDWQRVVSPEKGEAVYETVAEGPAPGQRAMHVRLSDLKGWDLLASPRLDAPFATGHRFTVFSAKGSPRTRQLSVEWRERDGSRWIAVVALTQQWQRYVLAPQDFHFWESRTNRANTRFNPENAAQIMIGLAFSHTGMIGGEHEYCVGPVGTAPLTDTYAGFEQSFDPPKLDTLWPAYKLFDCSDVASVAPRFDQAILPRLDLPPPGKARSPHPRPRGAGFDKNRDDRWIPLIQATGSVGQWSGTPATLTVHFQGPYRGGAWASFGIEDLNWYTRDQVQEAIGHVAKAMKRGVFIVDGGSDHYTYFEDQPLKLGIRVGNIGKTHHDHLLARVRITDRQTGEYAYSTQWPVSIPPDTQTSTMHRWVPSFWPEDGFTCRVQLVEDNRVIDEVIQQIDVWRPRPQKHFVTVNNSDFSLDGERWRPHGINYMPSSGIALNKREPFEFWLGKDAYDPEVIERDLRHIRNMGLNAVSVFIYHHTTQDQNLLDLLRRLDRLGMKANLSLRPGTPMDFPWDNVREMIEYYRLAQNDTVFAYDLAWEPAFRGQHERRQWDRQWERWMVERYGSIETAEQDWAFKAPRDKNGAITNPSDREVEHDGEWRRMVAAYRRFLDTLLYEKYSRARTLVRGIDPNHLVSFRMWEAGNPTFKWKGIVPYDLPYLSAAVDIIEPEAYGRIGDWHKVRPGWFTHAYSRWAAPAKPMIWGEMGFTTWDRGTNATSPQRLEQQADFYSDFYRMMIGSGADGVFFWWYPGGFRVGENSDFGVINPDGSDRPVTRVIRETASRFLQAPSPSPINHWIEFDRDVAADGLFSAYASVEQAFWKAIDNGKTPGLRTAGTGTDSTNCPLLAVGNVPYNGSNPPKYLDGFFDQIDVRNASGKWVSAANGDAITVAKGKPVIARITMTNLGEARWIAPDKATPVGTVSILTTGLDTPTIPIPANVPHLDSIQLDEVHLVPRPIKDPIEIELTLSAKDRATFGPKYLLRLRPVAVTSE